MPIGKYDTQAVRFRIQWYSELLAHVMTVEAWNECFFSIRSVIRCLIREIWWPKNNYIIILCAFWRTSNVDFVEPTSSLLYSEGFSSKGVGHIV